MPALAETSLRRARRALLVDEQAQILVEQRAPEIFSQKLFRVPRKPALHVCHIAICKPVLCKIQKLHRPVGKRAGFLKALPLVAKRRNPVLPDRKILRFARYGLPLLPQRAPFFLERVQLLLRLRLLPLQFFGVGKRLFFVH